VKKFHCYRAFSY